MGIGGTYQLWGWSDGLVVPMTLEISDSLWELGAFRLARRQVAVGYGHPGQYRGRSLLGVYRHARWQFLHRPWGRLYCGFGGSYKTETDYLDSTRWNFAYLLAIRFDLPHGSLLELAGRPWYNAWIKQPNRGQNFLTASVSFWPTAKHEGEFRQAVLTGILLSWKETFVVL
jgi:hypothetical protein